MKINLVELLRLYLNTPILPKPDTIPKRHESPSPAPWVHRVVRRLAPAIIEQLIQDYQAGVPTTQLTQRYGIGKGTVLQILEAHGVPRRHRSMTEAEIAEAIELYQQGWSLARVGGQFGRDPSLIRLVLMRSGVERRDTQGR